MPASTSTIAHTPMAYFYNTSPLLKECSDDVTKCRCTDPSYGYTAKCNLNNSKTDHSGRSFCTFNNPNNNGTYTTSVGPLAGKQSLIYQAPTNNDGKHPFTSAGGTSTINSAATTYPRGLMFCVDPTTAGSASPSAPDINLRWTGTAFQNWTTAPTAATGTNIGF